MVTIKVRENSSPTFKSVLRDFRNQEDPAKAVDVTGYEIRLTVKPLLDSPDSEAFFDLVATLPDPTNGVFQFDLSPAHTALRPDTYVGEIRWWKTGTPVAGEPPTDAIEVIYTVFPAVDRET